MRKNPSIGRFVFKRFELLSWIFTLLLVLSTIYVGYGLYNYINYGSCYGPENNEAFCIFDPSGENSQYSGIKTGYKGEIIYPSSLTT